MPWRFGAIFLERICFYVIAQILGAICGSATIGAIRGGYAVTGANIVEAGYLATLDNKGVAYTCAFVKELVLTFLFVLAVLGVTADDKFSQVGGLVIGMALTAHTWSVTASPILR